ncbi:substrate-binding domain-containing protein [Maritimibacter alkaliphilus]|uniref:substrate-binding domain-containing protein n=1 Tax=Maritimibacter alkaliphilus TaxID=404236 RepID=UPI001C9420F7|nr:phosphate ABC transporter substrate-binding/OmpA family protein [Maritimibacter alkaliphilus]MBY6090572.1 substrate-binding domain-containing protein [Maritimibacter alkaliphilus]
MIKHRAAILAALFLFGQSLGIGQAAAQDVTFLSRDGSVEVSGTLLGFDGEYYRVDTLYGELTVDSSGVICDGPGCPDLTSYVAELELSGAAAMGRVLLPALIEGFGLKYGYAVEREDLEPTRTEFRLKEGDRVAGVFRIHSSNTDEGFADLLANEADMVMALREMRADERDRARDAGMGDLRSVGRSRVLALDALVPIVAPGNPVTALTVPQLSDVLAGKVTNWQQLGGADAPIDVHLRDGASGFGQATVDRLLSPVGETLSPGATRHESDATLIRAVMRDPFALGVISLSELREAVPVALSGACGFTLRPTRRNAKTEDYPLVLPVFLYLPARRLPKLGREFLAYTRSSAAQLVIRRVGYVDQAPEEVPINMQGDRFANAIARAGEEVPLQELQRMVGRLTPMKRLTTSFRFEAGSSDLDAQSRSNILQLADALEGGDYDGRELLLVGFSDGEGPAGPNREIAQRRAQVVYDAIVSAAETFDPTRTQISVEAFGEAMPMACDDSAWGRQVNRRVEVWLR